MRNRNMISISSFDSVDEINPAEWETAVGGDYLLSCPYLGHIERTMQEGIRYHYFLVYEDSSPVAAAALFEMRLDLATLLGNGTGKKLIGGVRKIFRKAFTVKTLFIGSPPSTGNFGIAVSDRCKNPEAVVENLISAIRMIARTRHINMVLYKEMGEAFHQRYGQIFKDNGCCFGYDMPNNVLDIRWSSDAEYLDAMRSKSRYAVVRSHEKLAQEDVTFGVLTDIKHVYHDKEYSMYLDVLHKSDNIFETLTKTYFSEFSDVEGMAPCLVYIKKNDDIIGYFLTCDIAKDTVSALFAGIDYRYNHDCDTYFNLFHQVILYAMERGRRRIVFGQNTYEVKQRLGCTTEEMYIAFSYRNKLIQALLEGLSPYLLPKTEIRPRRTFK